MSENERESSSREWKRTDPPPSSQPLSARSYWSASARPAGSERSATRRSPDVVARSDSSSGTTALNGLWVASQRWFSSSHAYIGKRWIQTYERTSGSTRPPSSASRTRTVPRASWAWMSASATMRTRSPGPPPAASMSARARSSPTTLRMEPRSSPASSSASQMRPWRAGPASDLGQLVDARATRARHARRREADDAPTRREGILEHAEPRAGGRGSRGRAARCR